MKNKTNNIISREEAVKAIMEKHDLILLEPPEDAANIITKYREKAGLSFVEVGEIMGLSSARSRISMSEFENGKAAIKPVTYTLFAIALGFHPSLPEPYDRSKQLVFKVNETKGVDCAKFFQDALDETGLTVETMFDHLPAKSFKRRGVPSDVVKGILAGEVEPKPREWKLIQLAVNRFVSGFQYPEIILNGREEFGYSQPVFGEKVGAGNQAISNYETNVMLPGDHFWAIIMFVLDIHPSFSFVTGNREVAA